MATVYIGQATCDERGQLSGGKAGDQTGGEVSISKWSYKANDYNGWKYVFRAKNNAARLLLAQAMTNACNNNHIGYDTQPPDRKSFFKAAQKAEFKIDKISTDCETTCSELVNACIAAAGLKSYLSINQMAYVETLKNKLLNSNEFEVFTDGSHVSRSDLLVEGDILISESHVAMVIRIEGKATMKRVQIAREVIAGYWGSGEKRVAALKQAGYNPDVVQGDVNTLLCCRENIINNIKAQAVSIANNDNWWYVYFTEQYGRECAICHPHGGENHGWQCIGAGIATWHHGGLPIRCHCGVIDNGTGERIYLARTDAEALRIARNAMGFNDIQVIRNNGNAIPKEQAKPGDIALMFVGADTFQHLYVIMSQSTIFDSTSGYSKANQIRADRSFSGRYVSGMRVLIRYTGKGLCSPPKRTIDQLAYEVIEGLWGSGTSRVTALTEAGHNYNAVQKRVNEILNPPKPQPKPSLVTLVAVDVINGDYGNGQTRYNALRRAGYNPDVIQTEVNRLMTESRKKSIDTLAHEVINGFWKSGRKREKVLKACGCNYNAIQNRVNEILGA